MAAGLEVAPPEVDPLELTPPDVESPEVAWLEVTPPEVEPPATQVSSSVGVVDCWHVSETSQPPASAVHASQPPKRAFAPEVSHSGVLPLQSTPSSPQEQKRQPVSIVPPQMGGTGPEFVHLPCALFHISCTTQLRPLTAMASPALPSSQISAASRQLSLLSPQAAGYT
jgi:hypothetical protein